MSEGVYCGDCLDVLPTLEPDSVDACVTDPPYGLAFMGKQWDHGVPGEPFWREVIRVLKPGAHLLAFGGTRTHHRMMCAVEDAGFEIRDVIMWVFGSGFPKSLDVSKALDSRKDWAALRELQGKVKAARGALGISQSEAARRMGLIGADERLGGGGFMWFETGMRLPTAEQYQALKAALALDDACDEAFQAAEREVVGQHRATAAGQNMRVGIGGQGEPLPPGDITAPATDAAKQWQGWGTALKPAYEPIIVARKPLSGTVAANVLRYGTGAINVDGCRVAATDGYTENAVTQGVNTAQTSYEPRRERRTFEPQPAGRWPANLIHDGSEEVVALFPDEAGGGFVKPYKRASQDYYSGAWPDSYGGGHGDTGSAARFFYCAKASWEERLTHLACNCETVKLCVWVSEDRNQSGRTASTSPGQAISGVASTDALRSSTSPYGNAIADLFPPDTNCTTSTVTGRITGSPISSLSLRPNINDCTADASCEKVNGSSPARFAGECFRSLPGTSICPPRDGRFTGVVADATSPLSSGPSNCETCGSEVRKTAHPTQKPESLMRYLCRLVTPPGGLILDPFAGSGSTAKAALAEGFRCISIERDPEYAEIIRCRTRGQAGLAL